MNSSTHSGFAKCGKPKRGDANRYSEMLKWEQLEGRRMMTGTWSLVSTPVPLDYAQSGWVLTDGTIMVHGAGNTGSYFKLTPTNGSYVNGTWTTLHSATTPRLYFASQVLQSGKVFQVGGEYVNNSSTETWGNTGEIYDPVSNTWSNITNFPNSQFGDDPSVLLPNGQILLGYLSGPQTYIYNPATNAWSQTGSKLRSDRSDEESWVTLPDHSVLSYDVFSSISSGIPHAQRYVPSTGTWVDAGTPPAQLSSSAEGYELGPGLLLPDGRAFFAGATPNTAYYTESTNSWTAGPAMPGGYVSADAAGAVLPNGNLLLAGSPPANSSTVFPAPTKIFELNTTTNVYTDVTPSSSISPIGSEGSYTTTFLVLPTGQVAMLSDTNYIAVYTESGSPLAAAAPVITGITYTGTTGVYTLSGTNLNGLNDGAAYGDDNEMASNYPLVRLIDSFGIITYARTTNWSLTGVSQGAETVTFTMPATATTGAYLIQSVANGVPSATALAVLVNANTTTAVNVQTDVNPSSVDVVGSGILKATFADSSFSSIYFVGDNSGDTLTVNLTNTAGSIVTNIQAGTGTDTINVNQTSSTGPVVIDPSGGQDAVNVGTASAGTAIAQFLASQQIGVLTVGSGGSATVGSSGTKKLLQVNGVVASGTGVLDLTRNDMIVHGGNLAALTSLISSGFNGAAGGSWNGPGITSSAAAANTSHATALGIILNNIAGNTLYGPGAALGLFDGQSTSLTTDVLIKYTYFGDANLDGHVDGSDFSNIDNGFLFQSTGWFNGDFDYSNSIDGSDYTLIDNTFNTQAATIAASIATAAAPTKLPISNLASPQSNVYFSNQTIEDDETRLKRRDLHATNVQYIDTLAGGDIVV